MRIILTHEQTDFDGLASLLGAHILDEIAIPVLPRRMNRNVRSFITIYGADLPFIDPRDIEDRPIEYVYLVDTQSLVSIKGLSEKTKFHVIDHHSVRSDLPSDWNLRITENGANTTVFVEEIRERDIHLSVIEATLLLLGIYEDTGSLTYTRTTPRDVRAAATLLDQGANLSIVSDYINHPLSSQQQEIYDQLRNTIESHTVHGHNILIATGDARGVDEELSTIAHKLRDLVDSDAIILLVQIRGGIQLIARSTSDNINVSDIAAYFGGGGHPRAAAALIKSNKLNSIFEKLIGILPEFVHPATTVKEIMSRVPQLLTKNATIQEIAEKMQRYGYEGFPVVSEGKILGLVTRRSVDRALSHKLNLTAASLMQAGNVSIRSDDSIEKLQSLMTNTGWGQIPVVDSPEEGIIGIVTRTDLLETLSPPSAQHGKRNLADKLESVLPPERLALLKEIAKIAQEQRGALYIVGGFVRDLLLGYPSLDFDLVVEGDAITLAQSAKRKFGGRITTHKQFGTAKWFFIASDVRRQLSFDHSSIDKNNIKLPTALDFITARREFYPHPTALPMVERGSIKLDLHRRDFTINTLALRLDGHHYGDLHDYWGGFNDIRQGIVRVLHSISFVDDPTRMLRAVRYEQRYGFKIGERTLQLLLEARPLLSRVSGDRIRHEIDSILLEDRSVQMLARLHEINLLEAIHPDLIWDDWIENKISALKPTPPEWGIRTTWKRIPVERIIIYGLWLVRLPWRRTENVIKRLRLPKAIRDIIKGTCHLWAEIPALEFAKPSEFVHLLDPVPVLSIYVLFLSTDSTSIREALYTYITRWKNISSSFTGHDLQARGLPPGPHYKEILNALRAAWIDEEITTTEDEQDLLGKLIDQYLKE
jgi:tRNA nucleotidyltransferase (CCA-adding enzyme)